MAQCRTLSPNFAYINNSYQSQEVLEISFDQFRIL